MAANSITQVWKNSFLAERGGFILFPNAATCAFFALFLFLSSLLFFLCLYSDCFFLSGSFFKIAANFRKFQVFLQVVFLVSGAVSQ